MPAVGYTHPDQSHFTSRHYWEVGATDTQLQHRLARPLPRRRRHARQPAAGRLARRHARAGARDREDAGRRDHGARPVRLLLATASGARSRIAMLESFGLFGAQPADPALRTAGDVAAAGRPAAPAAASVQLAGRAAGVPEPGAVPEVRRPVPAQARRARGDDRRRPAAALSSRSRRPGEYDTHSGEPQALDAGAPADVRLAARVPARPRGARARRPRARPRVVGVRPARAGERRPAAPTTARPAPASSSARA